MTYGDIKAMYSNPIEIEDRIKEIISIYGPEYIEYPRDIKSEVQQLEVLYCSMGQPELEDVKIEAMAEENVYKKDVQTTVETYLGAVLPFNLTETTTETNVTKYTDLNQFLHHMLIEYINALASNVTKHTLSSSLDTPQYNNTKTSRQIKKEQGNILGGKIGGRAKKNFITYMALQYVELAKGKIKLAKGTIFNSNEIDEVYNNRTTKMKQLRKAMDLGYIKQIPTKKT